MILVGTQRGGAKDLALHLLKQENERKHRFWWSQVRGNHPVCTNAVKRRAEDWGMTWWKQVLC